MATTQTGGVKFAELLLLLFIGLKLGGVITWSWWWVMSPAWIPLGIVATVLIFAFIIAVLIEIAR